MGIPGHVMDRLVEAGKVTADGLGRNARIRRHRCGAYVIEGLDHHRCALRVFADPVAVDQLGELAAVLTGRATFDLWGRELSRRTSWHIAAGMSRTVIAEHVCGPEPPAPSEDVLDLFLPPKPRPAAVADERPPF